MPDRARAGSVVIREHGSFGVIWSLIVDDVTVDTYCPWNGDPRPEWMPDEGQEDAIVSEGYIERVQRLHVEHLRTCETCSDAAGRFCAVAAQRAEVLNALR